MQRTTRVQCAWIPVAPAHIVKKKHGAGKPPLSISLHDRAYSVFWNHAADRPSVVGDVCHHRGASLSLGTVDPSGCLACAYHGKKTRGSSRQTRVVNGVIWYRDTSMDADPVDGDDIPDHDDFSGSNRVHTYERLFDGCNPLLMQENTLDWLHLEFIHRIKAIHGLPVVTIHDENTATYAYETYTDGLAITVENRFWNWATCLRFFFNDRLVFSLHFAWVPCGKTTTKGIVRITRADEYTGVLGDRFLELVNELPLMEDRAIVQSIPDGRRWSDDRLGPEDAFLRQFREWFSTVYPESTDYYV